MNPVVPRVRSEPGSPPFLFPLAIVTFVIFGVGENMLLAVLAVVTLVVGGFLLWRPGEPPILLFAFGFQWLEASIATFYANVSGVSLDDLLGGRTGSLAEATALSLLGLIVMALALRLGAGATRAQLANLTRSIVQRSPPDRWLKLYFGLWLFSTAALAVAYVAPGLSQIMLVLGSFKWAGFVIFTVATFSTLGGNRPFWFAAFGVEFILSLGGFFSDFKEVFLYSLIGLSTAGVRPSPARAVVVTLLVATLLSLGVVWTAIKPEYRAFVSGGRPSQAVVVSYEDALGELGRLISDLDGQKLEEGARGLALRTSYVEFFGAALDNVPNVIPFEGGKLWFDAIRRPFMPRIFFSEKSSINDSDLVNRYTGLVVAGAQQGTSVSIGYMGESYIDFGPFGMMAALFALWWLVGKFYAFILNSKRVNPLLATALVCPFGMTASHLGTALGKLVGALAVYALVLTFAIRFVIPRFFPSRT